MRWPLFAATASLLLAPVPVLAAQDLWGSHELDGPYAGISAGLLVINDNDGKSGGVKAEIEYDPGFIVGLQAGYKFGVLRPEFEFEYAHAGGDQVNSGGLSANIDGDFDLYRMTFGLYYDLDNSTRFTPYFGGGLGAVYVDRGDLTVAGVPYKTDDDVYFTTHGEAGLAIAITDNISLVPAYRFFWTNTGDDFFDDDTAHIVKLGLRARF